MSGYVPDPNDVSQPDDSKIAETATVEFQAIKAKINALAVNSVDGTGIRNILVNGNMDFDQDFSGVQQVAIATLTYIADQWRYTGTVAGKFNSQVITAITPPAGYNNYIRMTVATTYGPVLGDQFNLVQPIEGQHIRHLNYGFATAKTTTLLFLARSSLTGLFTGAIRDAAGTRSYVFTYTIAVAGQWEQFAIIIPGDTAGANWVITSAQGASVAFNLGTGPNSQTAPNAWTSGNFVGTVGQVNLVNGIVGSTLDITGVEWKDGIYVVGSPPEIVPLDVELVRLFRYYWKATLFISALGTQFTTIMFKTRMRVAPTVTGGGAGFSGTTTVDFSQVAQTAAASQNLVFNSRM